MDQNNAQTTSLAHPAHSSWPPGPIDYHPTADKWVTVDIGGGLAWEIGIEFDQDEEFDVVQLQLLDNGDIRELPEPMLEWFWEQYGARGQLYREIRAAVDAACEPDVGE